QESHDQDVNEAAHGVSPFSGTCVINDLAADDRDSDTGFRDTVALRLRQNIAREHYQIRQLPRLQRAAVFFLERGVGSSERVSLDGFGDADLLLREPAARMLAVQCAAINGGVDT